MKSNLPQLADPFQDLHPSWKTACTAILALWIINAGILAIYRLVFHPLAGFPGPTFTAATYWYDYYWDVHRRGKFFQTIKKLHQRYGPVVRINPDEIHVSGGGDVFESLYSKKLDKYPPHANILGLAGATFGTIGANLHRRRRGAMNPFFAKSSINARMGVIQERVERVCQILEESAMETTIVPFDIVYVALTMDVICLFAFGENYNYLDHLENAVAWKRDVVQGFQSVALTRHFPIVLTLMKHLPYKIIKIISKPVASLLDMKAVAARRIQQVMRQREGETLANNGSSAKSRFAKTIFDQILDSDLPPPELRVDRLASEGQALISAGTETTTRALSLLTIHLLHGENKATRLETLRTELRTVMPSVDDPLPPCARLETLPYLTAVIKEGLRLQNGVVSRLPRITSDALDIQGWKVPVGTVISMSTEGVLMNEDLFPDPQTFNPERWLLYKSGSPLDGMVAPSQLDRIQPNQHMDRNLVVFGRGARQCVGMWLAYAELYLCVAAVFRRFRLELFETDLSDAKTEHDFATGFSKLDSKGVRVHVLGKIET